MTDQKPFQVDVSIGAPRDRIWTALTAPAEIGRWHGWDDDGLAEEIQYIYVDHATLAPPDRISLADETGDQEITLVPDGSHTIVRVTRAGTSTAATDEYDVIEEGWRSFFQQLRHYLERRPDEDRRTILPEGNASPAVAQSALQAKVPGRAWYANRSQVGIATGEYGGGLVIMASGIPVDAPEVGPVMVTLTTHGLGDDAFAAAQQFWLAWWEGIAQNPRMTPELATMPAAQ